MEVDVTLRDDDLVLGPCWPIGALPVSREVRFGSAELGLEQTLVDRSELAHGERPEVDGADVAVRGFVDQQVA